MPDATAAGEGLALAVRGPNATVQSLREPVEGLPISGAETDGVLIQKKVSLEGRREQGVDFLLGWYYPALGGTGEPPARRAYARQFGLIDEVVRYGDAEWDRLAGETREWRSVWYRGSIPEWILNRVGASLGSAASNSHVVDTEGNLHGAVAEGGAMAGAQSRFVGLAGIRLFPGEEERLLQRQTERPEVRRVLTGPWEEERGRG